MESSGIFGGALWLVINFVAVIFLGAALAYGMMRWRSQSNAGRAIGDRAAEKLSKQPESTLPKDAMTSPTTRRYVVPAIIALAFAFALGMLWWGHQATQTDLTQNPPATSGQSLQ